MVKKEIVFSGIISLLVGFMFFYKLILWGQLPFPGDLLIAEYKPWRSYSFLGYNPGSYPNKAQYPDTLKQLYPWKSEVINQLKSGHLPLWNPHNFSGTPLLANFQSAAFYPLSILYFLFSQPLAWSILVFLQPALSGFFTYWYCRKIGLCAIASALSAISFSYGSFMNVWLQYNTIGHVILWLPVALLAIENRWTLILILSLSLPFFAGHPQIAASIYVFSLIYFWIRTRRLGILVFLPLGIASIQLIPGIELILNSARNSLTYDFFIDKVLIQPWQLIMLVLPDFFGNPATRTYWPADTYIGKVLSIGLVPLFFFLATVRAKHAHKRIFFFTTAIILILATKNPLTAFLYRLPVLRSSSPTLFTYLFQFGLAILSGIGLDQFIHEHHTIKKLTQRFLQVIALLFLGFLGIWLSKYTQGFKALIYASAIALPTLVLFFIAIWKKNAMTLALTVVLFIHVADLYYSFHKFNPFVPASLVYPPTDVTNFLTKNAGTDRIWGYGTAAIEANFATQLGLYSPDGYDPLYPKWYGEFINLSKSGIFTAATRSDAIVTPGFGKRDLADNPYRLAILSRLGVKYILDRKENSMIPPEQLAPVYEKDDWTVYELGSSVPKVILASRYTFAQTKEAFAKAYFNPSFDPAAEVILDSAPLQEPVGGSGIAHIDSYSPNRINITVSTGSPKFLVLSDTYYPGWTAAVDGATTPIFRANWTMRGVSVPAGNHIVTFSYEPQSVRLGLIISIVSLVSLAVLLLKHEKV